MIQHPLKTDPKSIKSEEVLPLKVWQKAVVLAGVVYSFYYFTWRGLYTFHPEHPVYSVAFYLAELIGFANILLFVWSAFSLRKRTSRAILSNPTVDVFIPTFNEDPEILRTSIYHSVNMEYPHKTYVLDDGRRPEVEKLAKELGAEYLARSANLHAKSGNMNEALKYSNGEIIVVFDADGVPRKDFLTKLLGHFEDPQVAIVQVPQTFYNLDSFQHGKPMSNGEPWTEQSLFFDVCQTGRDRFDASICCGQGSLTRRSALEEIGGFPTQTVTEDIHTTLLMNAAGYKNYYHAESLAYCLAPATLEAFVSQRRRWALGSIQLLRIEWKRIFGRSALTLAQRLSYLTTIYYVSSIQKLLYLVAPFMLAVFGVAPLVQDSIFVPFMLYAALSISTFYILGRGRARILQTEIFALYTLVPYLMSVPLGLSPYLKARFEVTSKKLSGKNILNYLLVTLLVAIASVTAVVFEVRQLIDGDDSQGTFVAIVFAAFFAFVGVGAFVWSFKKPFSKKAYSFFDLRPLKILKAAHTDLSHPASAVATVISERTIRFSSVIYLPVGTEALLELVLPSSVLQLSAKILSVRSKKTVRGKNVGRIVFEIDAEIPELSEETRLELIKYLFEDATPPVFRPIEEPMRKTFETSVRNRRIDKRFEGIIPTVIHQGQGNLSQGMLLDFSSNGARIRLDRELALGTEINVELPWFNRSFTAKVKRCQKQDQKVNPEFEIGLSTDKELQNIFELHQVGLVTQQLFIRKQKMVRNLIAMLFLALGLSHVSIEKSAHAYGDLVYLPTYAFEAKTVNPARFGLYVEEALGATQFTYSSWTGSSRVYLNSATTPEVRWYTTQQDILYSLCNGRFKVGTGFGFTYATPSDNKQTDVHAVLGVRLW